MYYLQQCRRNTAPIKRSVSDDEPENTALIFIPFRIIQDSDGSSDTIELFPNVNPKRNLIPKTTTGKPPRIALLKSWIQKEYKGALGGSLSMKFRL